MPKYKVFLTRSSEYVAFVSAEDVEAAKAAGENTPLAELVRVQEGADTIEAWDAVRMQGGVQ